MKNYNYMKEHHKHHKDEHPRYQRGPRRGLFFWLLSAWAVMFLWNALVPDLFQGPFIGYWQALGLTLLGTLITGNFPGPRRGRSHWGHHKSGRNCKAEFRKKFKEKFREKMKSMTPEERRKFKEAFGGGRWDVNVIEVEEEEIDDQDAGDKPADDPSDKA